MSAARVRPIAHRTRTRGSAIAPVHSLRPAVAQPIDSYRRQAGSNGLASATARYRIFDKRRRAASSAPYRCKRRQAGRVCASNARRHQRAARARRLQPALTAPSSSGVARNEPDAHAAQCIALRALTVRRRRPQRGRPAFEAPVATRDEAALHATGSATRPSAASDANLSKDSAAGATTFRITGQPMYAVICMISSASSSRVHAASMHCRI